MSKADHDWTITISGRGPCKRGFTKDPDQVMLEVAQRLEKSGQSIEITDFEAVPLEDEKAEGSGQKAADEVPPSDESKKTKQKRRKHK